MSETSASTPAAVAEIENVEEVALGDLLRRVGELAAEKARLVTATCFDRGETFVVLYHFDRDQELLNLRLEVPRDAEVPSITGTYLCAFLVENEIKELFGLNITGIAIDYQGHMLLTEDSAPAPMAKTPANSGN